MIKEPADFMRQSYAFMRQSMPGSRPGIDCLMWHATSGSVRGAILGIFSYILSTFHTFRQNLENFQTQNRVPGRHASRGDTPSHPSGCAQHLHTGAEHALEVMDTLHDTHQPTQGPSRVIPGIVSIIKGSFLQPLCGYSSPKLAKIFKILIWIEVGVEPLHIHERHPLRGRKGGGGGREGERERGREVGREEEGEVGREGGREGGRE